MVFKVRESWIKKPPRLAFILLPLAIDFLLSALFFSFFSLSSRSGFRPGERSLEGPTRIFPPLFSLFVYFLSPVFFKDLFWIRYHEMYPKKLFIGDVDIQTGDRKLGNSRDVRAWERDANCWKHGGRKIFLVRMFIRLMRLAKLAKREYVSFYPSVFLSVFQGPLELSFAFSPPETPSALPLTPPFPIPFLSNFYFIHGESISEDIKFRL